MNSPAPAPTKKKKYIYIYIYIYIYTKTNYARNTNKPSKKKNLHKLFIEELGREVQEKQESFNTEHTNQEGNERMETQDSYCVPQCVPRISTRI